MCSGSVVPGVKRVGGEEDSHEARLRRMSGFVWEWRESGSPDVQPFLLVLGP